MDCEQARQYSPEEAADRLAIRELPSGLVDPRGRAEARDLNRTTTIEHTHDAAQVDAFATFSSGRFLVQ